MEGPRVFFATVLGDPLSEVTRKERVYLLGTSIVGIAILKTRLVPSRITALGIELEEGNQEIFLSLLGLVVLYFLAAFVVYAASDFLAWWEGYQAAWDETVAPSAKFFEEMEERLQALNETFRREAQEGVSAEQRQQKINEGHELIRQRLVAFMPSIRRRQRTRKTGLVVATIRALLEYLLPVLVGAYAAYILLLQFLNLLHGEVWDQTARDGVGAGSLEPCELTRGAGDEDAHVEEGNHNPRHAGNEEPAPLEGGGWCRGARAHPPAPRSCSLALSVTTPLYSTNVS
jgi:hypothetical protein